ncbi:MAG: TIGR04255 family protein [Polyangiaceae bacterium]
MPKLDAPPIIEVMCGVFFRPVEGLDPVFVGGWWREVKDDFPRHSLQAAVAELPIFISHGSPPVRSWLISSDDEWVLQIQPDRFYVNWRKRGGAYPRFSGENGVLERAIRELRRFREHCRSELGSDLALSTAELAKVDLVVEGEHWRGPDDLGQVLPVIADIGRLAKSNDVELGLNLVQRRPRGAMHLTLSLSTDTIWGGQIARAAKIETRCIGELVGSEEQQVREAFANLNADANEAFFGIIGPGQLDRFKARK